MFKKIKNNISNFIQAKKELNNLLSKIKPILINKKIILIGSSANVLQKKLGPKIDKFEVIVRFNGAPTKNYEENVGKKTDFIACEQGLVLNEYLGIKKNYVKKHPLAKVFAVIEDESYYKKIQLMESHNKERYFLFHNKLNHILRYNFISNYNLLSKLMYFRYGKKLSIGLIFISILKILKINFYIYGFDLKKTKKFYTYYYNNDITNLTSSHDFIFENYLILNLLKKKKISMLE